MKRFNDNLNISAFKKARASLEEITDLPSMPAVVVHALELIDDPNADINRLSEILSTDLAITSQILKLVNSAYYGFTSKITTIKKAVALLGFNAVKSLMMGVAVKPMLLSNRGRVLWDHSLRCAVGSKHLAKNLKHGDPEEAFILGLLHDVGKSVLQMQNIEAYSEVQKLVEIGADIIDTERTFFGYAHTDLGNALIEKWKLPLIIRLAVQDHHDPLRSEESMAAAIVYVADKIAQENSKYCIFDPEIIDSLDFEIPDPEAMREEVLELSQPIIDAFS